MAMIIYSLFLHTTSTCRYGYDNWGRQSSSTDQRNYNNIPCHYRFYNHQNPHTNRTSYRWNCSKSKNFVNNSNYLTKQKCQKRCNCKRVLL